MIGIIFSIKVLLVTGNTCRLNVRVSLRVAGDTLQRCMRSGERELSRAVIEIRRFPRHRAVTLCAVMAEILHRMIRLENDVEIGLMT